MAGLYHWPADSLLDVPVYRYTTATTEEQQKIKAVEQTPHATLL